MDDETEVGRFDNAMEAEMSLSFLREHGLRARLTGRGTANLLDRFTTVIDLRLMVPTLQAHEAREALEAMIVSDEEAEAIATERDKSLQDPSDEAPYRAHGAVPETYGAHTNDVRYARGVIVGLVFPGGAHLYARSAVMGWMLCAAILGLFIVGAVMQQRWMGIAAFLLIIYDLAHGVWAVRRHNHGYDPTSATQVTHGLIAIMAASVLAWTVGEARPHTSENNTLVPTHSPAR
ncbi:MAG: hypothetical protein Q8Q09_22485 [Deltaproteobacteria bacterium]|nr:hypothetical protein [Deltaproteobacteria bacterium]